MADPQRIPVFRAAAFVVSAFFACMVMAGCTTSAESPTPSATANTPEATPVATPAGQTPAPTDASPTPAPAATTEPMPTPFPQTWEPPDLQTMPLTDLFIQRNSITGIPEIRFTTSIVNLGLGPLVLVGTHDAERDQARAVQRIRTTNGEDAESEIGYFVYEWSHEHWHFERFSLTELWTHEPNGDLAELVTSTGKNSWCVTETELYSPLPEIYDPLAILAGCDPEMQAIATGWIDTYDWDLPGQQLDLDGVPDGFYAIRSTVNPDALIIEVDLTNNSTVTYIEIRDGTLIELDGPAGEPAGAS